MAKETQKIIPLSSLNAIFNALDDLERATAKTDREEAYRLIWGIKQVLVQDSRTYWDDERWD